jgi:hypothetical protein
MRTGKCRTSSARSRLRDRTAIMAVDASTLPSASSADVSTSGCNVRGRPRPLRSDAYIERAERTHAHIHARTQRTQRLTSSGFTMIVWRVAMSLRANGLTGNGAKNGSCPVVAGARRAADCGTAAVRRGDAIDRRRRGAGDRGVPPRAGVPCTCAADEGTLLGSVPADVSSGGCERATAGTVTKGTGGAAT